MWNSVTQDNIRLQKIIGVMVVFKGSTLDGLLWEMNEAEIVDGILKLSGTNMIIDNKQR